MCLYARLCVYMNSQVCDYWRHFVRHCSGEVYNYWQMLEKSALPSGSPSTFMRARERAPKPLLFKPPTHWRSHTHTHTWTWGYPRTLTYTHICRHTHNWIQLHRPQPQSGQTLGPPLSSLKGEGRSRLNKTHTPSQIWTHKPPWWMKSIK